MSLDEYQHILSEILTSKDARSAFLKDKEAFLESKTKDPDTFERLKNLAVFQIEESAMALIRKRWGTVKALLLISAEHESIVKPLYFEYALNNPIAGRVFKHQYDAMTFIKELPSNTLDQSLMNHLMHRSKEIKNYLIAEGEPLKSKPKWKRILKI